MRFKAELKDPHGFFAGWDLFAVDPCSWTMITCSPQNLVLELGAPSQSLSGTLCRSIGNLTNLKQVLLQNNNISGKIPPEIGMLPRLQTLDLSNNRFSGAIPDTMAQLTDLRYLRLNNNSLSGALPEPLTRIPRLVFLDLSYNNLSGPLPKFPARTVVNVVGNLLICGGQFDKNCAGRNSAVPLPFTPDSEQGKLKREKIAIAVAAFVGSAFLALFMLLIFIWWWKMQKKLIALEKIKEEELEGMVRLGNLRQFSLTELQAATGNFSQKNILGKGGFGNVYKGTLTDGTVVAVKRLKDAGVGFRSAGSTGDRQFWMEVKMISLAVHRNLLRLIGFCETPKEKLLVYPYMANGSVASRLRATPTLNWDARKRIALGTARGLLYLHEQCDPKIIHRDVKAANILLDDSCRPVIADFGLAKLIDQERSHATTAVRGTVGHIAPEYLSTGQSSEKTDVYGFGILLLELITGMQTIDFGKAIGQKCSMFEWVKRTVQEGRLDLVVDKGLGTNYDRIELGEMVQVALLCTRCQPSQRPVMSEVLRMLEGDGLAEKWENSQQRNTYSSGQSKHPNDVHGDVHGASSIFPMILESGKEEEQKDVEAIELSGPR